MLTLEAFNSLLATNPILGNRDNLRRREGRTFGEDDPDREYERYDRHRIWIDETCHPLLIEKGIELVQNGYTHVIIHRRSVTAHLPNYAANDDKRFRLRRATLHVAYELKDKP